MIINYCVDQNKYFISQSKGICTSNTVFSLVLQIVFSNHGAEDAGAFAASGSRIA